MFTVGLQLSYTVALRPYTEKSFFILDIINKLTQLYSSYLLIVFTDYLDGSFVLDVGN